MRKAIFLDRDGTLVRPVSYASRPDQLHIYEDTLPLLQRLQHAGFLLIVVTNQSGIARGYFTERDLREMHTHLTLLFARQDVRLDAFYVCPHHPEGIIPEFICVCACRKPAPGMLLQAAEEHNIDLSQSWCLGDMESDMEAGRQAGCQTCLIGPHMVGQSGTVSSFVAPSTMHALRIVQANSSSL